MKTGKTHGRKASTFDRFIAARGEATERLVINAARTVDASKYANLTEYCKDLAKIITQLRAAEAQSPASPFHTSKCRNFSHVTLLRNESYRKIIEQVFNVSRSNTMVEQAAEENLDLLKVQNAGLAAQISLLRAKIISMDSDQDGGGLRGLSGEYEEGGAVINELNHRIFVMLKVYRALRLNMGKAVRYLEVPSNGNEAGLVGVRGQVATLAELDQMRLAEESLPADLRKQLNVMLL
ncbi:hypothetical protein ALQ71_03987 [Pseudomonas coronafaciens pv. striafaciens]|uniref:hypothetical protein n=1 Tax=Pseudomonas coronafaciens TaxID=53409 RepID=UPI000EFF5F58|nr:hypothetical protein [Pseudomonas coronafaciens]RMM83442.1 hypothetical protein ALQ71_03987 [Pseudomonas coronafaciens pv. striafaciens]